MPKAAPTSISPIPALLPIYARNMELLAFKRGWDSGRLAEELGITRAALNRIRFCNNRYIDPDIFNDLLRILECTPNDLLLPLPDLDYSIRQSAA